jgi:lactate dehydrogenase-like 2-hydroxyacid dehydrogenase
MYGDLRQRLSSHVDLVDLTGTTQADLAADLAQVDVLLHYPRLTVGPEILAATPRLRAVLAPGAGYDGIDVGAAARLGILVTHHPGHNAGAVAEHAVGLLLSLFKRITEGDRLLRAGTAPLAGTMVNHQVHGRTLGLLGLGAIGRRTAAIARFGLGMQVIAHDPYATTPPDGVTLVPREELFATADAVSVHVPLTDETRGSVGAAEIALMPRHAVLLNTARGEVVDQPALVAALLSGAIAGAGLDVFEGDELPEGHPLLSMDSVVLTPHSAGVTVETLAAQAARQAQAVLAVLRGDVPTEVRVIDTSAVDGFLARFRSAERSR